MNNLEKKLKELRPTIEWKRQGGEQCQNGYSTFKAIIKVPSNYNNSTRAVLIDYAITKFLPSTRASPQETSDVHVIVIPGGPGLPGVSSIKRIEYILETFKNRSVAVYTMDHRGVGESSHFTQPSEGWISFRGRLDEIISSGPFPITDLTIANGALDVGMLALAIKDKQPATRIVLVSASYGSVVAHQSVKLLPSTFQAAILQIVPNLRGTSLPSTLGVAEHCARDEFCKKRVGKDVWRQMQTAVRDIAKIDANPCTCILANHLTKEYLEADYQGRVQILAIAIRPLLSQEVMFNRDETKVNSAQIVLPFLLATKQCLRPDRYKQMILDPIMEFFPERILRQGIGVMKTISSSAMIPAVPSRSISNSFANLVLLTDLDYYAGPPPILADVTDPSMSLSYALGNTRRYQRIFPYLKGYQFTDTSPLSTPLTHIYILQSRMDMNTTHWPAYELYQSIEAPQKTFALWDNYGHEPLHGDCFKMVLEEALGFGNATKLEVCLQRINAEGWTDWSFKKIPKLAKLWDFIKPVTVAQSDQEQLPGPPTLIRGSIKTRELSTIPPEVHSEGPGVQWLGSTKPSTFTLMITSLYFWLAIGMLLIISVGLFLHFFTFKSQRRHQEADI